MNYQLKKKWIDILRSGKYKQGRGSLRDLDDRYCCLGVLCDISKLGEWEKDEDRLGYTFSTDADSSHTYLPCSLVEYFGIEEHEETLVTLNDLQDSTFEMIADYIEENL